MQLNLGQKIRELRHRDGRTQEALADALGVTSQAVSRWEMGGGYPDMEMIPSIANYFGVSIDELFGYENDRSKKINMLTERLLCLRHCMQPCALICISRNILNQLLNKNHKNFQMAFLFFLVQFVQLLLHQHF